MVRNAMELVRLRRRDASIVIPVLIHPVSYTHLLVQLVEYDCARQAGRCHPQRPPRLRTDQPWGCLLYTSGVTEELKACDPMRWVGLLNSLKAQAEEIIQDELIYK